MEKSHILIFKDSRGNKRKVAFIKDYNDTGQPRSDQDILYEANLLIRAFCAERNFTIYYTHTWNSGGKTIFDVGSHTEFFHLIPAVDFTHQNKEEITDGSY